MASLIEVFVTEKRSYRQYPPEFREEAVALIADQGYPVQKADDSLGIRSNFLYRWHRQLEDFIAARCIKL
jgi:transposase